MGIFKQVVITVRPTLIAVEIRTNARLRGGDSSTAGGIASFQIGIALLESAIDIAGAHTGSKQGGCNDGDNAPCTIPCPRLLRVSLSPLSAAIPGAVAVRFRYLSAEIEVVLSAKNGWITYPLLLKPQSPSLGCPLTVAVENCVDAID